LNYSVQFLHFRKRCTLSSIYLRLSASGSLVLSDRRPSHRPQPPPRQALRPARALAVKPGQAPALGQSIAPAQFPDHFSRFPESLASL